MGRVTRFLQKGKEEKKADTIKLLAEPKADPDLARVIDAWPELPKHIKAAILALVATGK